MLSVAKTIGIAGAILVCCVALKITSDCFGKLVDARRKRKEQEKENKRRADNLDLAMYIIKTETRHGMFPADEPTEWAMGGAPLPPDSLGRYTIQGLDDESFDYGNKTFRLNDYRLAWELSK